MSTSAQPNINNGFEENKKIKRGQLLLSLRRDSTRFSRGQLSAKEKTREMMDRAKESADDTVDSVKERAWQMNGKTKEKAYEMRDVVGDMADKTKRQAHEATE
ncbi:uncharacterized protein LOC130998486 [Salvia miltiorrhiza]|uniref:uncharacterized protein LOC130998486 n=1 Tax=Salvia miltiorrhiza TaxID=226208 RepID=UPI0025AD61EE|nr:uncharacterized protein LOC130998486 [Salvia miltiorrhiza]